jgi:arylsulfatase A-like enzyme
MGTYTAAIPNHPSQTLIDTGRAGFNAQMAQFAKIAQLVV